ncbi:MAG TPA: TonB family protein [Polyangia bacterium]|nr:TonB family protein [Polyangia bacterium]
MHARIQDRWATGLPATPAPAPGAAPGSAAMADRRLRAVVLFAVRWDGTVAEANVGASSGQAAFDRAAVEAVRSAGQFQIPPVDIFSDDGLVHFRWTLARDQRLHSDGELVRREDPLEEALPRLFMQGRMKEALLRVKRRIDAGGEGDPMSLFARAWLARHNVDPVADVEAAAVLARLGDARQVDRLRAGLAFPSTTTTAVNALRSLKADVCAAVLPRLSGGDVRARLAAASILRDAGDALSEQSPCAQALAAIAGDAKQPGNLRAAALQTLGALAEPAARSLWPALIKESDPAVRAAAVTVSARPNGGRAALYRLIPYLRDPSLDVRAAAAAGMVHSAGELALDQFAAVLKDPDPRVAVAIARELGHLPTPAAAALLGRLARREAVEARVAAAQALAARQDAPARELLAPILAAAASDVRAPAAIRALAVPPGESAAPPADPEVAAFRALLADHKHAEAAARLVSEFDRTPQRTMVAFFAAWVENPPTARLSTAATEAPPAPAPTP